MGGCTIPFCNNSAQKGCILKAIPKDKIRRAQWIDSIKAKYKWTPSKLSRVCEVHFQSDMWEQRKDNIMKLKHNAVPTIFGHYLKKNNPVTQEIEKEQQSIQKNEDQVSIVNEKQVVRNESGELITSVSVEPTTSIIEPATSNNKTCALSTDSDANERATNKLEGKNKKLELNLILMRKQIKNLRLRVHALEDNIKNDKYKKLLNGLLNEDQIKVLANKILTPAKKRHRARCWSNATIKRALKLKFTCGVSGYEQLLREKMPLPSLRTLQRSLQDFKFQSGISNDMFHFLKLKVNHFQNDTDKECDSSLTK